MLAQLRRDPLLIGILFLALALRATYALQASGTPLAEVLLLDSEFYDLAQVPGDEVLRAKVDSLQSTAKLER